MTRDVAADIDALVDWQLQQRPLQRWRQCPQCRTSWADPDSTLNRCECGYELDRNDGWYERT